MTSEIRCEEARELAAEMALGTLAGDERAQLIRHLASCAECRALVEDLSGAADSVLLLAPEHEPPAGFENEFLAQFKAPARKSRLRWLIGVAAACVLTLASAGVVLWVTQSDRDLGSHYRQALEEANGEYFGVRPVQTRDGSKVGNLFVYEGDPTWVFVVLDESVATGRYRAELVTTSGDTAPLGSFSVDRDDRTWGAALDSPLDQVGVVRFSTAEGDALNARIQH